MTGSYGSKGTGAAIEPQYQFIMWLVPTIEKLPTSHKFTIGERIETTALDVLDALIEATYTRSTCGICGMQAGGSRSCASCCDSPPISDCWTDAATSMRRRALAETGRLIGGWMKSFRPGPGFAVGGDAPWTPQVKKKRGQEVKT